ncbi:hypothetical protein B0T10DRAFT_73376 [Thelonectria olida]|uniref:Uncharacterized protein n=1 Tax=Thelonectria olida TaxID=1576542 RepID=A0A9P9AP37_9HYPO|nr:hypothetical protein B0T10DRAFT_73376 [Thelonectria olida]
MDPQTHTLKPARRKLQKCDPKLKLRLKRASADSTASRKTEAPSPSPRQTHSSGGAPDLSDSKWSHYLRPKTVVSPTTPESLSLPSPQPSPPRALNQSQRTIPEFSHLNIHDATARPSLDSSSIPSPAESTSTSSTMRRQAKTPVFRIGQLENKQQPQPEMRRDPDSAEKTSSVELIADQYRALLESRDGPDAESVYSYHDPNNHKTEPWQNILNVPMHSMLRDGQPRSRASSRHRPPPLQHLSPRLQPTSNQEDDMVGFEEDAIYFKPISFSTEASPEPSPRVPQRAWNTPPSSRPSSSSTDNLSLQICLDLLTRELSSAMSERPFRSGPDTAALQVWVMIEAYERLRDQVMTMSDGNPQFAKVGEIFDTWLNALYAIHGNMRGVAVPKESEYVGLQEDLD